MSEDLKVKFYKRRFARVRKLESDTLQNERSIMFAWWGIVVKKKRDKSPFSYVDYCQV